MLDPRVGRWFKPDPLFQKYPYDSPFMFSGNSPISIMDPDGKRKRKVTITYDENGNITKFEAKIVDYTLKRKVRYETCSLSGDAVKVYDYYDTTDVVHVVKDKNNKVLSTKIHKNDTETLSHKGVSPIVPELWLKLDDKIEDIPTVKEDPLMGNEKGHYKGGITLVLDDSGNILNIRGLERMNSATNTTQVDITELYAIASGQVGAPSISHLDNANALADGIKVMEQAENAVNSTVKQIEIAKEKNSKQKPKDSVYMVKTGPYEYTRNDVYERQQKEKKTKK
ncbi:YD repeat-containing protein [Flavobacterium columnare]|nr:YD repeat-containing protein [Flavobacterium columnare]APT22121.1 hypothetical protein BU993_05420 [Flavobacterium columnare]